MKKYCIPVVYVIGMIVNPCYANQKSSDNTHHEFWSDSSKNNNQVYPANQQYWLTWSTSVSSYSPTQPIHQFVDDWSKPLDSGEMAFVQGRTAVDYKTSNSVLGYGMAMRYDYLIKFNEPTAQVYWRYKNDTNLEEDNNYPLMIDVKHNQRFGTNLFADIPINMPIGKHWIVTPRANIWKGVHAVDGHFSGNINTLKENTSNQNNSKIIKQFMTATADLDYHYDQPALKEDRIGWNPNPPKGYGYSFDLALAGDLTDKTHVSIQAFDVLGKMHWKNMPMTHYELDYDVTNRPLYTLEGQLDDEKFEQTLPWRVESKISHKVAKNWKVNLSSQFNDASDLHQISATYQAVIGQYPIEVSGIIEPQTDSFGLDVDSKYIGFKWLTDDIDTTQAKRGDIQLYMDYKW